eukprot:COSAG02_NODE_2493_length_8695_cov_46.139581_6_plen_727_part_01
MTSFVRGAVVGSHVTAILGGSPCCCCGTLPRSRGAGLTGVFCRWRRYGLGVELRTAQGRGSGGGRRRRVPPAWEVLRSGPSSSCRSVRKRGDAGVGLRGPQLVGTLAMAAAVAPINAAPVAAVPAAVPSAGLGGPVQPSRRSGTPPPSPGFDGVPVQPSNSSGTPPRLAPPSGPISSDQFSTGEQPPAAAVTLHEQVHNVNLRLAEMPLTAALPATAASPSAATSPVATVPKFPDANKTGASCPKRFPLQQADILPAAVLWAMVSVAAEMLRVDRSLTLGRILYDTACKGRCSTKRGLAKEHLEAAVAKLTQQQPSVFTGVNRAVFKNPEAPEIQCSQTGAGERATVPWRFDETAMHRWSKRPRSLSRMAGWAWMVLHSCASLTLDRVVRLVQIGEHLPPGVRELSMKDPTFFTKVYQQALAVDECFNRGVKKRGVCTSACPRSVLPRAGAGDITSAMMALNNASGSGVSVGDRSLLCESAWAAISPSSQREAQLLATLRNMYVVYKDAHARAVKAEQELAALRMRCGEVPQPLPAFRMQPQLNVTPASISAAVAASAFATASAAAAVLFPGNFRAFGQANPGARCPGDGTDPNAIMRSSIGTSVRSVAAQRAALAPAGAPAAAPAGAPALAPGLAPAGAPALAPALAPAGSSAGAGPGFATAVRSSTTEEPCKVQNNPAGRCPGHGTDSNYGIMRSSICTNVTSVAAQRLAQAPTPAGAPAVPGFA